MAIVPDAAQPDEVDRAIQHWRQGDVVLSDDVFMVHIADRRCLLTETAQAAVTDIADEYDTFEVLTKVSGLVVVSQTCDIVRKCSQLPFVELCPLVTVADQKFILDISKGRRPQYAYLPQLRDRLLVADIGRTMTAEKTLLAKWPRVEGCSTDEERAAFAAALARKRQRFAFPDGFNTGLNKFRNNIKAKSGNNSSEGRLVDAIREIRVQPNTAWESPDIKLFFWFLIETDSIDDLAAARSDIQKWMGRIKFSNKFSLSDPAFSIVEPRDMTVSDYFDSFPIDYDDVSS